MIDLDKKQIYAQKSYDMMKAIPRDNDGNPLTLEGAIRSIILKNPVDYRDDALGTLYCVLGAAIGWSEDGRLRDRHRNNYMNMPPGPGGQGCWSHDFGMNESLDKMFEKFPDLGKVVRKNLEKKHEEELIQIYDTIDNIDARCQQYSPKPSWYPISWYGCNLCCPSNAQEDFFRGAIETANLIIATEPDMGTRHWIDHQRTKSYAEEILSALMISNEERKKNV
jgi:hypothetical protein